MNRNNLHGFLLLTMIIGYYVMYTLSEGHTMAWYAIVGVIVYAAGAWLILGNEKQTA